MTTVHLLKIILWDKNYQEAVDDCNFWSLPPKKLKFELWVHHSITFKNIEQLNLNHSYGIGIR